MKEIHFFHCLALCTLGPWDDPAHLKQCGSYHSVGVNTIMADQYELRMAIERDDEGTRKDDEDGG